MYKQIVSPYSPGVIAIQQLETGASIPIDPANTDYQQFKLDITNGAELQDADSNVMTAEQVQAFLETLP